MLWKFIIFFIGLIFYNFSLNLYRYKRCVKLHNNYIDWLDNRSSSSDYDRMEVINLFKKADVGDVYMPYLNNVGFGKLASYNVSMFDTFPSRVEPLAVAANKKFMDAMGVYKSRAIYSLNPFFWIEQIIFLPKAMLSYLGFQPNQVNIKIINILLTVIWWLTMLMFAFNKGDIQVFLIELISKF